MTSACDRYCSIHSRQQRKAKSAAVPTIRQCYTCNDYSVTINRLQPVKMIPFLLFLFLCFYTPIVSFSPSAFPWRTARNQPLYASGKDELESMRKLLETSWNADTMGQVPSDAKAGANEAFASILSASDRGVGVFFVDLLLPAYDVTQGSNLYDEVLSVEYCIALSNCLKGKTEILVRDEKTLQVVNRVLDARDRDRQQIDSNYDDDEAFDDVIEEEDENQEDQASSEEDSKSEVDDFRQKLMSNWNSEEDSTESVPAPPEATENEPKLIKPKNEEIVYTPSKDYRLASLFGNSVISQGIDMMEDVVKALRVNALPSDEEENMIILSAISREEMIAVRSLVAKYDGQKKVILVNCKLDPIPRELLKAETVYSLLPLIAKPKSPEQADMTEPKVVVLRRYPKNWEVFVDVGSGFQLAETAPANQGFRRNPPMEWIAGCVERFLDLS